MTRQGRYYSFSQVQFQGYSVFHDVEGFPALIVTAPPLPLEIYHFRAHGGLMNYLEITLNGQSGMQ